MHAVQRTSMEIAVNGTALLIGMADHSLLAVARARRIAFDSRINFLPLANENSECLLKIFAESYNASLVSSHDNDLSALHVGAREELHYFIRQLRGAVVSGFRSCWRLIQKRAPQLRVMTMNNRSRACSRLVDCGMRQGFRRGQCRAFVSDFVLLKIARHYFCAVCQR